MFRIDNEVVEQRLIELRQKARQRELASRCIAMKREKENSVLKTFLIFFRR